MLKELFVAPDEFFEISDYEYGYLRGDDLFARGFWLEMCYKMEMKMNLKQEILHTM